MFKFYHIKRYLFILLLFFGLIAQAQTPGERLAKTTMLIWKDSVFGKWSYDLGVILKGMEANWYRTGDATYYNYIQKQIDFFVNSDGTIRTYKPDEYNIDHINNGKLLLLLYRVTEKEKYWKAAQLLRSQLATHPRTKEGGFWHKKIYPHQMWLDGLYMAQPFYAEYAMLTHDDSAFNDIANQFILMEKKARDPKTGLLFHGWDESKEQKWANNISGTSPLFWARAMGWYATALVDALEFFPSNQTNKQTLISILNRLVAGIEKQQDIKTGLWKDILNYNGIGKEKNYFEASATAQFIYAIAKGVRLGYLPSSKISIAKKAYSGMLSNFVKDDHGQTNLYGTVKVSGLGGKPYRDGSFEYYMSEPVITNDPKGVGAFLLAANEMDLLSSINLGKGKTVLLDNFFNAEKKKDISGYDKFWHYKWDEKSNGGFFLLGNILNRYGFKLNTLSKSPTRETLSNCNIYIIVDADNIAENPTPNFMSASSANEIATWVDAGGVLVIFHNDKPNADFQFINLLTEKFGIHINEDSRNKVEGNKFEQGALLIKNNPIFKTAKKVYLKEIATLTLKKPAEALYSDNNEVIMATAKYGKGFVFVVADPWLYNEYIDGRKLPNDFDNFKAAEDLVKWLHLKTKR